jgi:formate dehydrogenase subunit gamma
MSGEQIVRFNRKRRIEHITVMVLFVLLCLTGFPQKFYTHHWAEVLVHVLGGIDLARRIHHLAGYALALMTVVHFGAGLAGMLSRSIPFSMMPTRKDFEDAIRQLRYYLGQSPREPLYDRYTYKEKFEYWGLVAGNVIMVFTGTILSFPLQVTALLPGVLVPAAKMAHSNEGLMAFLVITIWHIFNVHLNPDAFPFDPAIFTGKITRERYLHEHPLELARLEGRPPPADGGTAPEHPAAGGKFHGGEAVAAGYYLDAARWSVAPVARDGDRLPAVPGRWRRVPAVVALALVPVLGGTFLMFLPLAGFLVLGGFLADRIRGLLARGG